MPDPLESIAMEFHDAFLLHVSLKDPQLIEFEFDSVSFFFRTECDQIEDVWLFSARFCLQLLDRIPTCIPTGEMRGEVSNFQFAYLGDSTDFESNKILLSGCSIGSASLQLSNGLNVRFPASIAKLEAFGEGEFLERVDWTVD